MNLIKFIYCHEIYLLPWKDWQWLGYCGRFLTNIRFCKVVYNVWNELFSEKL